MYYGDEILFSTEGPLIPLKALLPIGVANNSRCWGIWVPEVPYKGKPPHLLISTFYPENWHILFRVTLKLSDSVGALAKAAKVLDEFDFNILSTQCSPSGHRHTTWNIIGEALAVKKEFAHWTFPDIPSDKDVSNSPEVMEFVSKKFSPRLFRYGRDLRTRIVLADADLHFLHDRFKGQQTLLYKWDSLPDDVRENETNEIIQSVKCSWLQNLATFWLYGSNRKTKRKIAFRYNEKTKQLKPQSDDLEEFSKTIFHHIPQRDFPIRVIASFDHQENYVRIVIPRASESKRQLAIQVHYNAQFSRDDGDLESSKGSKGLLREVSEKLTKEKINLHYVSNATTHFTQDSEKGVIHLIGAPSEDGVARERGESELQSKLRLIPDENRNFDISEIKVEPFRAKRIFISTKLDWIRKDRAGLWSSLQELCKKHGLISVKVDSSVIEEKEGSDFSRVLTEEVITKIRSSQAFLQILPLLPGSSRKAKNFEWVNFELGIARGVDIPWALCIDEEEAKRSQSMRTTEGWKRFHFHKESSDKMLLDEIEQAVKWLANQAYE